MILLNPLNSIETSKSMFKIKIYFVFITSGQCLNFTCTFILVCMLRKSITFLRSLGASVILPLDEHIYFHKLTGWLILIFTIGHTVAHIGNLGILLYCN